MRKSCRTTVEDCLPENVVLTSHLLNDAESACVFAWFEQRPDEVAFDQNLSSPHATRPGQALDGKLEGDMVIRRFDAFA